MGVIQDEQRFFRSGAVGQWREEFDSEVCRHYERAVRRLVPDPMSRWLHEGPGEGDDGARL